MKNSEENPIALLEELLGEITACDSEKTKTKMLLAVKIDDAIKSKGWNQAYFAKLVGQSPSTITKWLSGSHNFTTDTLIEIGHVLNEQFLYLEKQSTVKFINYNEVFRRDKKTGKSGTNLKKITSFKQVLY